MTATAPRTPPPPPPTRSCACPSGEWYANTVRTPGSSATTPFTTARRGPGRDLIAELASATRWAGLRLGLYYSGALDRHVSDFPLTWNDDLFALRRNDPAFAAYAAAQLRELIDRFAPDLLWNDIDWSDAGKHPGPDSLVQLFTEHLAAVPDGLANDRWGAPVHGVLTREYQEIDAVQDEVFEATRGLGLSFGCNADESAEHALDGPALIRLLVDVVSKNGNLLINVGPRADSSVPPLQSAALEQLGAWLGDHGAAIFGTRPWFHEAVRVPPAGVRFTRGPGADGGELLHVFLLDPAAGRWRWTRRSAPPCGRSRRCLAGRASGSCSGRGSGLGRPTGPTFREPQWSSRGAGPVGVLSFL